MKKSFRSLLYGSLVLFCAAFAIFIFFNGKNVKIIPELRERQGALAAAPEWEATQKKVAALTAQLKTKPDDEKTMLQLAKEFMQEGRASGDYTYYNKSALELINQVLIKNPKNFDAACLKAMVYLSQHRFTEGKAIAETAMKANPYNSFIYGLLCDANVELGDYATAVQMADKMVSTRPDIRSYSRVSYLRELHGDMPGAIEAINMAIEAGFPGNEDRAWARMVLAHLYEQTNQLDKAEGQYNMALQERPNYPFALAGLGKIARYKKDYPTAVKYLEQAKDVMADAAFFEELIDLYNLNAHPEKANKVAENTLNALLVDNISANKDKDAGHYSDRELALLYVKLGQLDNARKHAEIEHQRRPQNIDACETLAWINYKQQQADKALPLIQTALRTKYQNPELLVKAGLIYIANGKNADGKQLIEQGLSLKPYMDETLASEAKTVLAK